jgi:uncharacterized membrane protein SpoIIM required for sporulation/uncharacterized RDD family membrane protein YckC
VNSIAADAGTRTAAGRAAARAAARVARLASPPEISVPSATGIDACVVIAGPGARSIAFVIDFLIRGAVTVVYVLLMSLLLFGGFDGGDHETLYFLAIGAPAAAIYFLYHVVLEPLMGGRTPGKRMIGIRIVTLEGLTPSTGALITRNLFRIVDSMPVVYVVGLLFVMFGRRHARLGDLAAGTVLAVERAPFLEKMGAARGLAGKLDHWSAARARAMALRRRAASGVDDALAVVDDYRQAARQLGTVRAAGGADATEAEHLEAAYADLHDAVHRPPSRVGEALLRLFRDEVPAALRTMRAHLLAVTLLFVIAGVAGFWLIYTYPDLIELFASDQMVATVERGELWTDGLLNVVPSSVVAIQILTNNIIVSIFAYCSGVIFGLGTFYLIGLNGLLLGSVFAFTAQHELAGRLFDFVVAHGCVELSCICIAGAAGAYLGEALIRPGEQTRGAAFRAAAAVSLKVMLAVVVLLVVCGFIEGYVSPDPEVPRWARVTIGVGFWFVMISFLRGYLFGRSRQKGGWQLSS